MLTMLSVLAVLAMLPVLTVLAMLPVLAMLTVLHRGKAARRHNVPIVLSPRHICGCQRQDLSTNKEFLC